MLKPLEGNTVVLTGTTKSTTILTKIQSLGGEAISCPLIETKETIHRNDDELLQKARIVDWLIFTSQNGVRAFCDKMKRHHLTPAHFNGRVAAVGTKTAKSLEQNGFQVSFMPTVFSADVFVKEFPAITGDELNCLFIKGNKAKDTLKRGLPFDVKEWTVYDTHENLTNIQSLIELVQTKAKPILIFASPSAVDVFANHVAPITGWDKAKLAAIGHITAARIAFYGAEVTYKPKVYTMEAVIEEIQRKKEINHERS
ncbi:MULTISPECIES: uroporphyrinogen-III synthase [Bacillales]|uniref:Uroporphyrinogen-III synthase n=1 Tax=Lysinibacillus halotolerans TaxID=1368476 RepID=A0A3M8HBA1_9BACI|nr:uroporphyrinogen-III synthase [Lysinibacillus halotolerans]RNC99697.1 uroporphyrinogen-III synthase [Lysinibacillus halotolerans]